MQQLPRPRWAPTKQRGSTIPVCPRAPAAGLRTRRQRSTAGLVARWGDSKQQPDAGNTPPVPDPPPADVAASDDRSPASSRRLINQLLQIKSLASIDLAPTEEDEQHVPTGAAVPRHPQHAVAQPPLHQQQQQQEEEEKEEGSLFDDPAAEDFDPMALDMLGFTSVQQYLQSNVLLAAREAKVALVGLAAWGLLTAALLVPLGGPATYGASLAALTHGGTEMSNLTFVWMGLLAYYCLKGLVMSGVTALRARALHSTKDEATEQLAATVEAKDQRRAYWQLQDKLHRADDRANRTYTEFALASLLLGLLLALGGGLDDLQLEVETLGQAALSRLLVMMWLLFESYFTLVGSVVKFADVVTAVVAKWQHERKWGSGSGGRTKQ